MDQVNSLGVQAVLRITLFFIREKFQSTLYYLLYAHKMRQKRNYDFTERYPNTNAGTNEPMLIEDILTKNRFFAVRQRFKIRVRHNMT